MLLPSPRSPAAPCSTWQMCVDERGVGFHRRSAPPTVLGCMKQDTHRPVMSGVYSLTLRPERARPARSTKSHFVCGGGVGALEP